VNDLKLDCVQGESLPLKVSITRALQGYFQELNGERPCGLYDLVLSQVEESLLAAVMEHTGGNQTKAAAVLGINRNTLRKKLRSYA